MYGQSLWEKRGTEKALASGEGGHQNPACRKQAAEDRKPNDDSANPDACELISSH